jgi:hypothetical protein
MVLGPSMDGGEALFVMLLPLQCAVRLLEYQCKSLHPTISLDYKWFLRFKGVASSVAHRNYANIACSISFCYYLFSSPFFMDWGNRRNLVITVSEIMVCSLANHFLPGAHGGAKLLTVQFLMFLAIPFL